MAYSGQLVVCSLREFKTRSSDILLQVLDRGRSGNRQDHFGTFEEPRQCDLQRSCIKFVRKFLDRVMCLLLLTERSPRKEHYVVLLAVIDDEVRFPISEAVAVLHGDNRYDPAGPLHVFARHIRERDMADLTVLAQPGECFYRCLE